MAKFEKELTKMLKESFEKSIDNDEQPCLDDSGHEIIDPTYYYQFMPTEFVDQFSKEHYSDFSDYKETISKDGKTKQVVKGVFNLDILYGVCKELGINTKSADMFFGRGRRARMLLDFIKQKVMD